MTTRCTVCLLPSQLKEEIDRRLRAEEPLKSIAEDISLRYKPLTTDALSRHRNNHLAGSPEPIQLKTGGMDVLLPINVHYVLNKIKQEILDPNFTYNSDQEHLINTIILEKVKQQLSVSILILMERYNQQETAFPKEQFQAFKIVHSIIKDLSRDHGRGVLENTIQETTQELLKNMQGQKIFHDAYKETAAKAKKYVAGKIFGDYLEGIHFDFKYAGKEENRFYQNGFKKWCKENPDHPMTKDYCLLKVFKYNMTHYNTTHSGYLTEKSVNPCMKDLKDGKKEADEVLLELKNGHWSVITDALED